MSPELLSTLERLAQARFNLVPADLAGYFVFERDGFVCLVEKSKDGGFGSVGSVCRLFDEEFAVVLFYGERAFYARKGQPRSEATADEIALYRAFSADLRAALKAVH